MNNRLNALELDNAFGDVMLVLRADGTWRDKNAREALRSISHHIQTLQDDNGRLRAALEYYADPLSEMVHHVARAAIKANRGEEPDNA